MISLENDTLKVQINTHGAELCAIYHKKTQLEYLWNGNPTYWKRHAPVLFPIVGKLKENQCVIDGKTYEMNQHGFARDMEFRVVEQETHKAVLALEANEESLIKYPFLFSLRLEYELYDDKIITSYEVLNKNSTTMPFSIGAHPAFNCPLVPGTQFEDYHLCFEREEVVRKYDLDKATGTVKPTPTKVSIPKKIPLNQRLFENDALIFENVKSKSFKLASKLNEHGFEMTFDQWQYMAFWSPVTGAPFICFEPWMGIADTTDHNGQFIEKMGMLHLAPNATYNNAFTLRFY